MKYSWGNKSVLFAEDDDASFVYLSELLKRNNVNVIRCSSGLSAFFYCMNNPNIDLVLMDMKLHELNGFEATRLIKKYQHPIPVIAVTACAMLEDRRRCKIAGCNDYLPKPILPNDFLQLVNKYLSLDRIKLNFKEQLHF